MDAIPQPQPAQSGCRQDQAVVDTGVELLQTGDHIPPHVLEHQMGVVVAQLGQPPQGAGAHHAALGKGGEGLLPMPLVDHQGIGGILPFGDAAQDQPLGQVGRQVLEAVHRDVGPVDQHLGLQFLGEQTLVADLGQGDIEDLVPLGGHGLDRDRQCGMGPGQFVSHPVGLDHGQLTAAGGDAQGGAGHRALRAAATAARQQPPSLGTGRPAPRPGGGT